MTTIMRTGFGSEQYQRFVKEGMSFLYITLLKKNILNSFIAVFLISFCIYISKIADLKKQIVDFLTMADYKNKNSRFFAYG